MKQVRSLLALSAAGAILAVAFSACSSPVSSSGRRGGASLSVKVGGVLPGGGARASRSGPARALLPVASATVRVRISGSGIDEERSATLGTLETLVQVGGLPAGEPLGVVVDALDAASAVLTTWSGTVTLQEGSNPLSIVLAPPSGAVTKLSVPDTAPALGLSTGTLVAAGAAFYEVTFQGTAREWQLIADTGTARWMWMQAYDADWRPLTTTIAADPAQGWTVFAAGGGSVVRIAVANTVASPGYPASSSATYTLQARPAYFTAIGGGGSGTSQAPTQMGGSIELPGISIFMQEGDTVIDQVVVREDVQIYGGFSSSSWAVRDPTVYSTWISNTNPAGNGAFVVGDDGAPAKGRLDGVTVVADPIADGYQSNVALNVKNLAVGSRYVITNTQILGSRVGATSGAYTATGLYAASSAGLFEISSSTIRGGASAVYGTGNSGSRAIDLSWGAAYIHDNDIDGGYVNGGSGNNGNTWGISANGIADIDAVIAGNRIWGGRVTTGGAGSSAMGIYVYGPAASPIYIANNVVSGGYSALGGVADRVTGIALADGSGDAIVVGNTVDGGSAAAASSAVLTAIRSMYSNTGADAAANAAFVSNGTGAAGVTRAAFEADYSYAYFRSLVGNTAVNMAAPYIASSGGTPGAFSTIPGSTTSSGNAVYSVAPGSAFKTYRADAYDADTWFAANDLAFAASADPGARVDVSAYIPAATIASYPALGLDAAGKSRPANGLWYRGAFEP